MKQPIEWPPAVCSISDALLVAAQDLVKNLKGRHFAPPVTHVYNPLVHAWEPFAAYTKKFGDSTKHTVFLGMNPGPFGMTQTGVPFGEIAAVRDWMGVFAPVGRPAIEHPARPIEGFDCPRSEVSGRRLWGWAAERFGSADQFFRDHFVLNYCPLVFIEESGRNRTPDKLPVAEMAPVYAACDGHLARVLEILQPKWVIGVGGFAEKRLREVAPRVAGGGAIKISSILHPSPASPAANRGWAEAVDARLQALGILPPRASCPSS
ncbi:MAG: uracil-DNA glycosylase family protein [Verrucomicrobiales bacterium]